VQIETPVGWFRADIESGAVVAAGFADAGRPEGRGPVHEAVHAYFAGDVDALRHLRVEAPGTGFQRRVWRAVRMIPAGSTTSYGGLAIALGAPGAARAVGRANAANPVALVVPCHRVVRADGDLGGYAGGVERKRWLLDLESRSKASAVVIP
jgi:methylated-DNA-[protein]-cysteine S-methyltransferase